MGYQYPHSFEGGWVDQRYLPDELGDTRFYEPTDHGREARHRERLEELRRLRAQGG